MLTQGPQFWQSTADYSVNKLPSAEALRARSGGRQLEAPKNVAEIIGNKGLTSEILNGNRDISKAAAQKLSDRLGVSIELFL